MSDVLVVGAGPAGSAAAITAARAGCSVTLVDREVFPRQVPCGDLLTPRALVQLDALGLGPTVAEAHRLTRLRVGTGGHLHETVWPTRAGRPANGAALRRSRLDTALIEVAMASGVTVLQGHEAVEPIVERGFVRGVVLRRSDREPLRTESVEHQRMHASFLVVADGANSRFGRALGTFRRRDRPVAIGARGYWRSPAHDADAVEIGIGLRDLGGTPAAGRGWVVPLGDGTVDVGVTVPVSAGDPRRVNTARLLADWAAQVAERWGLDPTAPVEAPLEGRLPLGGSVRPTAGPTFLVVGDAAGTVNPFSGLGIDAALETGVLAGELVHQAVDGDGAVALQRYPRELHRRYGRMWSRGLVVSERLARPAAMRALGRLLDVLPPARSWATRLAVDP